MPRRFFRIVLTDPPTREDFISHEARGRPLPPHASVEAARLWSGLSVYATEAQARRQARSLPALGGYLAELQIPGSAPVRDERTTRGRGHYTLWGNAADLLAYVVRVMPVEAESDR